MDRVGKLVKAWAGGVGPEVSPERAENIASGVWGAVQSPFGLVKDFAVAPWKDEDDFDGFFNTIKSRSTERGGQVLRNLFGPDEGFGALIGGLPADQVREPAKRIFEALEWTYREGISEPIQTLQYVNERTDPIQGDGWAAVLSGDVWSRGHELANSGEGSPGKNVAYTVYRASLDDPEARKRAESMPGFGTISASMDGALRLGADPTVLLGKAATAARLATVTKPIKPGDDLERILGSDRVRKFNSKLEGKNASEIRDQFFPNDINGAALSSALADAGDAKTRESVLLLAMGDRNQLKSLYREKADLAGRMERLTDEQNLLRSLQADNFAKVNLAGKRPPSGIEDIPTGVGDEFDDALGGGDAWLDNELDRTTKEVDALYGREELLARSESIVGQIRNQPRYRRLDETRVAVTRSQFYQSSPLATPVRMTFNMRPPRMLDLNDPAGDIGVTQYLRKSGMDKESQDIWRTRYMAASTPEARGQIVTQMEDDAIARLADEVGLSPAELQTTMSQINANRATASQVLKGRVYDGEGRSRLSFKDDADGTLHEYPLLVSQTANVLPLADIDAARRALSWVGEFKQRHPGVEVPQELLTRFNQVWKPSVLLRFGWPIRVVMDEQMRIMGKIGVLATLSNLKPGIENKIANSLARTTAVATRGFDENGVRISREDAAAAAEQRKTGFGTEQVGDYEIPAVFGEDVANPNAAYSLTASKPAFERAFADAETQQLNQIRQMAGEYKSIAPDEAEYGDAWLNAVNQQIGRDPLARIFLKGGDHEDAVAWLRTPEGRAHLAALPLRRRDLDAFAGAVQDQVESYTLGNPEIMQAALRQRATADDLFRVAPDPASRPMVHGEILSDAMGKGATMRLLGGFVEKMYTALGSVPSDTLSRHPFAAHMYRAEATRLTDLLDVQAKREGKRLTADDLKLVEKRSREYAIDQTRKLLYDLSEQSDMAHLLRFVSPFYSAWQETMVRWSGIAIQNPAYAMQLKQVWESPERGGIVTDEFGNEVSNTANEGDEITLPDGTKSTIGRERLITLPIPRWATDIMGLKGVRTQGEVRFNKKSFNMILQGNPGVGVPVQLPVNEIVKNRPELADSMRFVLPFGPTQSKMDMYFPATARRLAARSKGEEDRVFRNAALRIYFDKVVDYNTGKRQTQPTWKEAIKDTNAFYNVRTVANWVLPASPGFRSPYQPYIDAYRRLRAENLQTADERFITMYGKEFFPLTQSFTKSADGVPPTVEAFTARSKYKDLIEQSPELGALIIGEEGAGEYANAIYQHQLANKVAPGSTTTQRYALSFEDVQGGPNTRLGWLEYRKVSDMIDAERIERGLPNLQVKAAEDLSLLKKAMVGKLSEKYPEWYAAFSVVDRNAQAKRLVAMRAIADDPRMADRPDMQGVRTYFDARQAVRNVLAQRKGSGGSDQLDASTNQDVSMIWDAITAKIVERNLAFSDTYYRYLERDDLSAA